MRTGANIADSWFCLAGRGFVAVSALSRGRIRVPLAFVVLASLLSCGALSVTDIAQAQGNRRHVLVLHAFNMSVRAAARVDETARNRMDRQSPEPFEFHTELLDLGRFPGADHEARMLRHLADKYRDRKIAMVIAIGAPAISFAVKNRNALGFEAPVIHAGLSPGRLAALNLPADITGVLTETDLVKTLTLAERLQPDAKRLLVVSGADDFDKQWATLARRQFAPYERRYETRYLEGLSYEDLSGELQRLSPDTIVVVLTIFRDGAGKSFVQPEIVRDLAAVSGAPIYTPYEAQLGSGIVGGHMDSYARVGEETADLALEILAGADPSTIAPRQPVTGVDRVDWRQLGRWNISESRLPAGADVQFREFSLWERYRWQIVAIVFVVIAQAAALAGMIVERHRRQAAQAAVRQRLLEVMHLNRSAMAGALSASVAHELNQPLAAIQSYADTAEIYLKASPLNVDRLEEMLSRIRADNQRAAEIISHFRGLLKRKESFELQELDVNDVVRNAVRIIDSEALKRGVSLSANPASTSLPVRADEVHLQQVILNLAVNGMDAMQDTAASEMSIQTALVGNTQVEVSVADTGAGIPADKLNLIFDTFYTTKRHGTGLGLSIARTIVETYGGRIWAENRPGGGAAFRFTLPLSKGASA